MSKSIKSLDRRCIFRETFQSVDSVRKNGGVITSGTVTNGKYLMTYRYDVITYPKISALRCKSFRIRYKVFSGTGSPGSSAVFGIINPSNIAKRFYFGGDHGIYYNGTATWPSFPFDNNEHEIVFTQGSFYVDGEFLTNISTAIDAFTYGNLYIGSVGGTYIGNVEIYLAEIYNKVLSASEVKQLYNQKLYNTLPAVITDNTPNCFEGNSNAIIQVSGSSLLSFGDGVGNDQPFWISAWVNYQWSNGTYMGIVCKELAPTANMAEYGAIIGADYITFTIFNSGVYGSYLTGLYNIPRSRLLMHLVFTYDGSKTAAGLKLYINGTGVTLSTSMVGTYTGMAPTAKTVEVSSFRNGSYKATVGQYIWDARLGSGTLTTQQIQDIYLGRRVGTERLWLPLCENAGNTRFDVSGNNLHGTLKGTQDGKYNVGKQNKFDYYSLFGGSSKGNIDLIINSLNNYFIQIPSIYYKAIAFRFLPNPLSTSGGLQLIVGGTLGGSNQLYPTFQFESISGRLAFRNNTFGFQKFDGTGNSVSVPTTYFNDNNVHTIIIFIIGLTVNLIIDGISKGYVTTVIGEINSLGTTGLGCYGGALGWQGYAWDFRTWDSEITQEEALKYHNDTMTVSPSHKYSLTGDNPAQDLIGTNHGTVSAVRPINIPLLASNQQPVLPAMTDVTTTLPVVQRSFREVFRLNATKGSITDDYGKPLTINGNVKIKQVGKSKGIYFGGTTSDYINCGNILNTELKDGFVIKMWYVPITTNNGTNVFSLKNSFLTHGITKPRFNINNGGSVVTSAAVPKIYSPTLYIICVDREISLFYDFNKLGLASQQYLTGQYFVPNTNSLIFGSLTVPSKFILFDVSISTAGILSLEEATQIWVSEKQNYL